MLYNVVDNVDAWFYEIYNVLNIIVDQPESITQYKKLRDMPHLLSYKIKKNTSIQKTYYLTTSTYLAAFWIENMK